MSALTIPAAGILYHATRATPHKLPRPISAAAKAGIAYERRVLRNLQKIASANKMLLECGPWFAYTNANGAHYAVPDAILHSFDINAPALLIEIKLTYVPDAPRKLRELYVPVVHKALALPCEPRPLIIARNLNPDADPIVESLSDALRCNASFGVPTMQWLGHAPLRW